MKLKSIICSAVAVICLFSACQQQGGIIKTETPQRPAGQEDVIGMTVEPIDTINVAIIGLGARGYFAVYRYLSVPWTKITAVCDVEPEKVEQAQNRLVEYNYPYTADGYVGEEAYKEICEREDIDLVYICTDWKHHTPIALYALDHGKNVAIEVPSATTLQECWDLVNASERNRRHCVILENCCYDFYELNCLQIARDGLFGEIMHLEGSYNHNLSDYWNDYWRDWRLEFNRTHKGDVYPTHGLGPIAQVANINRGDRFTTVSAMETKSVNGVAAEKSYRGIDCPDFQNGDITCTLIGTEQGKTLLVEHDVMTHRPYDRMYQIVGTKGYAGKYPVEELAFHRDILAQEGFPADENQHAATDPAVAAQIRERHTNPIINQELEEQAKTVGGHGGMDFLMDYRLCYCLHYGLPVDMDVYDLASWCCISELGAISIANNGAAVEVPDFTRGAYTKRDGFKYAFNDGSFR